MSKSRFRIKVNGRYYVGFSIDRNGEKHHQFSYRKKDGIVLQEDPRLISSVLAEDFKPSEFDLERVELYEHE